MNIKQKLENDIEFIREGIAKPFYWLACGFALLMILPNFLADFPDYGVSYWYVFGAIFVSCAAQLAGHCWASRRFDRGMKKQYPELFENKTVQENSSKT